MGKSAAAPEDRIAGLEDQVRTLSLANQLLAERIGEEHLAIAALRSNFDAFTAILNAATLRPGESGPELCDPERYTAELTELLTRAGYTVKGQPEPEVKPRPKVRPRPSHLRIAP